MPRAADLRGQQPHHAGLVEISQRVHEVIDEVTVTVPPPQQNDVDHLADLVAVELVTGEVFDIDPQIVVAVLVPTELLHHLPGNQSERSEEHTSELQSRGHLVCRLLLEKKKKDV